MRVAVEEELTGQCQTYGLDVFSFGSLGRHDGCVGTEKGNQVSLVASLLFVGCFVDAIDISGRMALGRWALRIKAVRGLDYKALRRQGTKARKEEDTTLDCTQLSNFNAQYNWNITTSRPNYE